MPHVDDDPEIVASFHRLYYGTGEHGGTWQDTHWLGHRALKCPLDMWMYQEILHEVRPDVIVETGTFSGGSALYLANLCDILGSGRILTIDVDPQPDLPEHPRITYIRGSSTAPEVVDRVRELSQGQTVMAILDSDHHADHVLAEMRAYAPLIEIGSYLVVEDTNVNGNPVLPDWGPGPREAVQRFLGETDAFVVDREREKFFMTFNPGGYLKRVR